MQNKAWECKKLTDYISWLFYCWIHSKSSASLSQSWKNQMQNFYFVHFSFYLSSSRRTWNYNGVCKYYYPKWLLCYQKSFLSGLGRWRSYGWRAIATKWSPSMQDGLVRELLWLLFTCSRHGTYSQAWPWTTEPVCYTDCDEFANNELCTGRSLTIVFSIYLVYLKTG